MARPACALQPRSPWENGYIESFNGNHRDELLERDIFATLLEAKVLIERWRVKNIALLKLEGYTNDEFAEMLGCATRSVERNRKWIRAI